MKFKIIIIGLACLLFAGCERYTYVEQISKAEEMCKNNEGLDYISSPPNDEYKYVYCNNKALFRITPEMAKVN